MHLSTIKKKSHLYTNKNAAISWEVRNQQTKFLIGANQGPIVPKLVCPVNMKIFF